MSLTKQIHVYAIGTDAFYNEAEQQVHERLLTLYALRKKITTWIEKLEDGKSVGNQLETYTLDDLNTWKKETNNQIKQEKENLTELLDASLGSTESRVLNEQVLSEKNVISLFESSLTRALEIKTNELSEDIFVVSVYFFQVFESIVKHGFYYKGEKYIFFTASAGQIRQKKAVFLKESSFKRIEQKIMCGLTIEEINAKGGMNQNKFLAYLALMNSATEPWEDFDIDKSIVVDDFETEIDGEVDFINYETYEIERKKMKVPIPHMDGAGIMQTGTTRMCRLPFVKGLMIHTDFHSFIKEKCPDGDCVVYDIYGEPHKIIEEDIQYIFTKSQFKLH